MNEAYVELLVKRKGSPIANLIKIIFGVIVAAMVVLMLLSGSFWFFLIGLIAFAFAYVAHSNGAVEYEYLCLNKELSVDKIKNQTSRKTVADFDLNHLEIMAPAKSGRLGSYLNRQDLLKVDYSAKTPDSNAYTMVLQNNGKTQLITIEVNEELLSHISKVCPRKVFHD